ncbi:ABC transporter permease [Pseudonocardia cypriaca]|uniref:Monosaccharide ABC transporter membrane protein (CUT2 family) n=1 Tax=Pseudonocardia cypriaca TaxID=882449 RepID=A0A543FPG8_9PSEU|nr:ABC transporter permease [Pseudonocardia cypriaca]TQM35721.1 monosaccharide ABC transporter membrane protein (CUT2 family) [Pseudonocardia cypriaca]
MSTRSLARLLQQQGALIALVALVVFGALRYGENFATGFNVQSVLADDAKYALVALGMCFVIMTGGIDLSVGSVVALGGVVAAQLSGAGLLPAMLAALAVGAAVGAVNGVLVARYRLAPFLVTLATLLVARGLALYLADARSAVADPSAGFTDFGAWRLFGVPVAFWLVAALFALGALALHSTDFGRNVLATGGNEEAARLMGLPVDRTKFAVYVLSGALAGIAGAFLAAQSASVDAAAGQGWELTAIAAVVVGGTLLTGGVGSVFGTLVGVLLLQLIFNLIVFENSRGGIQISSYWESVIRGAFLLAVVLLQVRLTRRGRTSAPA